MGKGVHSFCAKLRREIKVESSDREIRILTERKVYENGFGELFDDIVEFLPQGERGTYVRWRWKAPYSVAILPILTSERALLVRSYRHSARGIVTEAVKGFGIAGRPPAEVAAEELKQELGLRCEQVQHIGEVITDPGFTSLPMHLFLGNGCNESQSACESTEVIVGSQTIAVESVPSLLRTGEIKDAVTIILLWEAYSRMEGSK